MLLRELDKRLGLTSSLGESLIERRDPALIRYTLTELLRQRLYGFVQGYRHQDDMDRTAHDPAMRLAVWEGGGEAVLKERLSSQPAQSRLLDALSEKGNLEKIRNALSEWQERFTVASGKGRKLRLATLDVYSFEVEVYGHQEGGRYNGHFRRYVYHPWWPAWRRMVVTATPAWARVSCMRSCVRVKCTRQRGWNPPPAHAHMCLVLRQ